MRLLSESLTSPLPGRRRGLRTLSLLGLLLFAPYQSGLGQLTGPPAPQAAQTGRPSILIYGDSLSAAYGLRVSSGWPSLLEARLERDRLGYRLINRSLSGETSFGGLQRLERILQKERPAILVLALGANDGLRGLALTETERNLSQMAEISRRYGAQVLLVGITLPPNFGPDYAQAFLPLYQRVADRFGLPLLPFMLEGFAAREDFFQADRIHPNERAQALILDNLWPVLRPLLVSRPAAPR